MGSCIRTGHLNDITEQSKKKKEDESNNKKYCTSIVKEVKESKNFECSKQIDEKVEKTNLMKEQAQGEKFNDEVEKIGKDLVKNIQNREPELKLNEKMMQISVDEKENFPIAKEFERKNEKFLIKGCLIGERFHNVNDKRFCENSQRMLIRNDNNEIKVAFSLEQQLEWKFRCPLVLYIFRNTDGEFIKSNLMFKSKSMMNKIEEEVKLGNGSFTVVVSSTSKKETREYCLSIDSNESIFVKYDEYKVYSFPESKELNFQVNFEGKWAVNQSCKIGDENWIKIAPKVTFEVLENECFVQILVEKKNNVFFHRIGVAVLNDNEEIVAKTTQYLQKAETRLFFPRKQRFVVLPIMSNKGIENDYSILCKSSKKILVSGLTDEEQGFEKSFKGTFVKNFNIIDIENENFSLNPFYLVNVEQESAEINFKISQNVTDLFRKRVKAIIIGENNKTVKSFLPVQFDNHVSSINLKKGKYKLFLPTYCLPNRDEKNIKFEIKFFGSEIIVEEAKTINTSVLLEELNLVSEIRGSFVAMEEILFNPQYHVSVRVASAVEIQLERISKTFSKITFYIFKGMKKLSKKDGYFFKSKSTTVRSVESKIVLEKGDFIVVPYNEFITTGGEFKLRFYSSSQIEIKKLEDQKFFSKDSTFGFLTKQISTREVNFNFHQIIMLKILKGGKLFFSFTPKNYEEREIEVPDQNGNRIVEKYVKKINYLYRLYNEKKEIIHQKKCFVNNDDGFNFNFMKNGVFYLVCLSRNEGELDCMIKSLSENSFEIEKKNEVNFFQSNNFIRNEYEIEFNNPCSVNRDSPLFQNNVKISFSNNKKNQIEFILKKVTTSFRKFGLILFSVENNEEIFSKFDLVRKEISIKTNLDPGNYYLLLCSDEYKSKFTASVLVREKLEKIQVEESKNKLQKKIFTNVFWNTTFNGRQDYLIITNGKKRQNCFLELCQSEIVVCEKVDSNNEKIQELIKKDDSLKEYFDQGKSKCLDVSFNIYKITKENLHQIEINSLSPSHRTPFLCTSKHNHLLEMGEEDVYVIEPVLRKNVLQKNSFNLAVIFDENAEIKHQKNNHHFKEDSLPFKKNFEGEWKGEFCGNNERWPCYILKTKEESKVKLKISKKDTTLRKLGVKISKGDELVSEIRFENVFKKEDLEAFVVLQPDHQYEVSVFTTKNKEGSFAINFLSNKEINFEIGGETKQKELIFSSSFVSGVCSCDFNETTFNPKYSILSKKENEKIIVKFTSLSKHRSMNFLFVETKLKKTIFRPKNNISIKNLYHMKEITLEKANVEYEIIPVVQDFKDGKFEVKFYFNEENVGVVEKKNTIAVNFYNELKDCNNRIILKGNLNEERNYFTFKLSKEKPIKLSMVSDNEKMCKKGFILKKNDVIIAKSDFSFFNLETNLKLLLPAGDSYSVEIKKNQNVDEIIYFTVTNDCVELLQLSGFEKTDKIMNIESLLPKDDEESELQKLLLKNVEALPDPNETNIKNWKNSVWKRNKASCPLVVFKKNVEAIITGETSSYVEDGCAVRRRELLRLMKMGRTEEIPILFYEPYVAAGTFGKGKIVVVGEERFLNQKNFNSLDTKQFFQNVVTKFFNCKNGLVYDSKNLFHAKLNGVNFIVEKDFPIFVKRILSKKFDFIICFFTFNFDKYEKTIKNQIEIIRRFIKEDAGNGIFLGNVNKFNSTQNHKFLKLYPGNLLLHDAGIMFCEGGVAQNTGGDVDEFYWLDEKLKKKCVDLDVIKSESQPCFSVKHSRHTKSHVLNCLKKVNFWIEKAKKMPTNDILYSYFNIIYSACWNAPPDSEFLTDFFNPNLYLNDEHELKYKVQLAVFLNKYYSMEYEKLPRIWNHMLFPGGIDQTIEKQKKTVVKLLRNEYWIFTSLYADSGELIKVIIPKGCESLEWSIQIGTHCDCEWFQRDRDLIRFPILVNSEALKQTETVIANPFGGIIMIVIHSDHFFEEKLKGREVIISGGVPATKYILGETTPKIWDEIESKRNVPICELQGKKVIFNFPSKEMSSIPGKAVEEILIFWDKFIGYIEEFSGSKFEIKQRVVLDKTLGNLFLMLKNYFLGNPHSGYPLNIPWKCFSSFVNTYSAGVIGRDAHMGHEIGHNMHGKQNFLWMGRVDPIANCFSNFVHYKLSGSLVRESKFFVHNYPKAIMHMKNSSFTQEQKSLFYLSDSYCLSTMLDLILLDHFGFKSYQNVFKLYYNDEVGKGKMNNQEKIDLWVRLYCKEVQRDLCDYFELWGLEVSKYVEKECSVFEKYLPQ